MLDFDAQSFANTLRAMAKTSRPLPEILGVPDSTHRARQHAIAIDVEIKRTRHKLYTWLCLEKVEDLSEQHVFTEAPPLRPDICDINCPYTMAAYCLYAVHRCPWSAARTD